MLRWACQPFFTGSTEGATAVGMFVCATMTMGCAGACGVLYRIDLAERWRVVAFLDGMGFDALLVIQRMDPRPGRALRDPLACVDDWYGTDPQVDRTLDAGRRWVFAGGCGASQNGPDRLDVAIVAL